MLYDRVSIKNLDFYWLYSDLLYVLARSFFQMIFPNTGTYGTPLQYLPVPEQVLKIFKFQIYFQHELSKGTASFRRFNKYFKMDICSSNLKKKTKIQPHCLIRIVLFHIIIII